MILISSRICDELWLILRKVERLHEYEELAAGQLCIDDPEGIIPYEKGLCVYSSSTGRVYPAAVRQAEPSAAAFLSDWARTLTRLRTLFVDRLMSGEDAPAEDWVGKVTEERAGLLRFHGIDAAPFPKIEKVRSRRCPLCGGQILDGCCLNPACGIGKSTEFLFEEDGVRLKASGKDGLQVAEKTDLDRIRDGNFGA